MTLDEIYRRGIEVMEAKGLTFNLDGMEPGFTLKHNEEVFKKYMFRQKAIGSVEATTRTKLLDVELKVPIIMSSITMPIPLIEKDGLLKVARALKEVGSMMSLGTPLPPNIEELVATGVPLIQTAKPLADREQLMKWISRADEAGVTMVGVEVDAAQGTRRAKGCAPISVDELKEIKRSISKPFILKGILSAWDAEKALEAGADIIVVSNHGAHTIDYLPHPLDIMGEIEKVVNHEIPIIMDGGFRWGTDILKGLAFGAQAIGLGRPILLGLAADGEDGVKSVITEMAGELKKVMTLTGVTNPSDAHRGILLES